MTDSPEPGDVPLKGRNCPSGRSVPGATLIGIVGNDATVGYLNEEIPLDEVFLEKVEGRAPMQRFRFSEPCVEAGCTQWTGSRCGLIDEVLNAPGRVPAPETVQNLPRCPIRKSCRWFHQVGRDACHVCPLIVRGEEENDEWALAAPSAEP